MGKIIWIFCLPLLIGCSSPSRQRCCKNAIEVSHDTSEKCDIQYDVVDDFLRSGHPTLFVIPIAPISTEYHARALMKAQLREEIAYHIISIGILGKETPEVTIALEHALFEHDGKPVPLHFDWPDSISRFRNEVEKSSAVWADIPGSRGNHFWMLIKECLDRIKKTP